MKSEGRLRERSNIVITINLEKKQDSEELHLKII